MTKSDLRTGMIVTLRNGNKFTVYRNVYTRFNRGDDILTNGETWMNLNGYQENLLYGNKPDNFDIMKVEKIAFSTNLCKDTNLITATEFIWEREEPKRMTISEIEAALGYKVEIVAEEENK